MAKKIICDKCFKDIQEPILNRTYYTLLLPVFEEHPGFKMNGSVAGIERTSSFTRLQFKESDLCEECIRSLVEWNQTRGEMH